ncbi:phosphomevalonate kinase [Virgibacillus alimentarius]|uniref:phosphomevalonate kinase n=1 Tax=Virgibacillus alimentarius TaxID=698769 RepID=UPI00049325EB|nr:MULTISPECIES: phosphomevalonate kinase [Virgibacillus]HLR68930.1 phosphomevalonate kinase [Virgibacillus sp.]
MSKTSLTIKVPGKLMIAGEFAVLEPHHKLVVMAVNRFVYATIEESHENFLTLENFNLNHITWDYENSNINVHANDDRIRFAKDAMTIALNFLEENSITTGGFSLKVKSELDDISGVKYGLGSSAAVVTSIIAAILKKYLPNPSASLIFKLAAISHVKTQGNGSGADVAASSYGGMLKYASFQAEWLKEMYRNANSLMELLEENWSYLSVHPVSLPENVHICIGWTGNPASTAKLVDKVLKLKQNNTSQFGQFLDDSAKAVTHFYQGMQQNDIDLLLSGVKKNRQALSTVGNNANVDIETPLLGKLCDLAEQFGGAGKPSGAGGGDCGIAFMPSKEKAKDLFRAWEAAGIKPLDIELYGTGASTISSSYH